MNPDTYSSTELGFDSSRVSDGALEVVEVLQAANFDGYLVGGCVRDLVVGRQPKDFDVTTNARPEQVKDLFPRARIIGRRFKIVHVTFGKGRHREIIEVATYRAAASDQQEQRSGRRGNSTRVQKSGDTGRILRDNVFGTLEGDIYRRDFSVNALYYDPCREEVLDFIGGVADLKQGVLRVIGDIDTRFAEDPVRMIRAVRFKSKLGLEFEPGIDRAIHENAQLLEGVPAARLFDEVLKLFHHGAGAMTWKNLRATGLASILFPQTVHSIEGKSGHRFEDLVLQALKNTDNRINRNQPVIAGFFFAVILWQPYCVRLQRNLASGVRINEAQWNAAEFVFKSQSRTVSIPWRVRTPSTEIWEMQPRLESRIPRTITKILENRRFRAAYDFLLLRSGIEEVNKELSEWWTKIQECTGDRRQSMIAQLRQQGAGPGKGAGKRRRRHRRRPAQKPSASQQGGNH